MDSLKMKRRLGLAAQSKFVFILVCVVVLLFSCSSQTEQPPIADTAPFVVVLGVAQDAGLPQANCEKECCRAAWDDPSKRKMVSSLGIVDPQSGERWIIDATPDFKDQLRLINEIAPSKNDDPISGVLLTHGHMGHYTGLIHLGFEAMASKSVPVYAMPRMQSYLSNSGPWDQLLRMENIEIKPLQDGEETTLNARIKITPFLVPHRDEYTETVGYVISGPEKSVMFIPDIDKWEKWQTRIEDKVAEVDRAYLDGSFFASAEVGGRDMSGFPHPFIVESMQRFSELPSSERGKITFIHLNHTNPALDKNGAARKEIEQAGFHVAETGERFSL